ncbi:sensor histidine kinase [Isoptericola sp. NPDC019693]|uniref:sensor histidine kinase n=1 Tax=Isoptericola sp. NPDC019693 TaxID=3364009 RepID=UPI00378C0026
MTAPVERGATPVEGDPAAAVRARDRLRLTVLVAGTNFVLYALVSLAGWAGWGGLHAAVAVERGTLGVVLDGVVVLLVNLAFGAAVIAGTLAFRPLDRPWPARVLVVTCVAAVASVPRILALAALTSTPSSGAYVAAVGTLGLLAGVVGMTAGLLSASLVDRARTEQERREEEALRAARVVEELQGEEVRVRRHVFDQLHGTLQFHLVTVTAGLDRVADELAASGDDAHAADLRHWAETLEEIREQDVRSLSHAVFPSGADMGTQEAIQVLLRRLPPQIDAAVELGDNYQTLVADDGLRMPMAERLVVIYTVEEAVTNALRHGHASRVRVHADAEPTDDPDRWVFVTVVDDDGSGPPRPAPPMHGLRRHRERIEYRGGTLTLGTNPGGGGRLAFRVPFTVEPEGRREVPHV